MKNSGIENCNCMAIRRAARRISQAYDDALAPTGLRATQFAILATLEKMQGTTVNRLASQLDLDGTTTGKNLRPLERDGLVSMQVSTTDRRSRVVALTEAGKHKLGVALPLWATAQEQVEGANGRKRMRGLREELANLRMA